MLERCPGRVLGVTILLLGLFGRAAYAASEGQWEVGAGVGYALASVPEGVEGAWRSGGLLGLEAQRGLSDSWALRAGAGFSLHPASDAGTARAVGGSAGVTYSVDVLRVVPFGELGAAFLTVVGPDGRRQGLGFEGGLGATYFLSRRWTVALVGRAAYLPLAWGSAAEPKSLTRFQLGGQLARLF